MDDLISYFDYGAELAFNYYEQVEIVDRINELNILLKKINDILDKIALSNQLENGKALLNLFNQRQLSLNTIVDIANALFRSSNTAIIKKNWLNFLELSLPRDASKIPFLNLLLNLHSEINHKEWIENGNIIDSIVSREINAIYFLSFLSVLFDFTNVASSVPVISVQQSENRNVQKQQPNVSTFTHPNPSQEKAIFTPSPAPITTFATQSNEELKSRSNRGPIVESASRCVSKAHEPICSLPQTSNSSTGLGPSLNVDKKQEIKEVCDLLR
jgi:hypothetical protein